MEQYTKLDFTDQDLFIGLDIHKKNWTVCIYSKDFELKKFSQNPDTDILMKYLQRNYPGANYHSVYEAGYCGFWIHEALTARGINNIVVNPADVPTTDKERKRKNNRVDTRKLARSLRSGDLEPNYLRSILIECSWVAVRKDPALTMCYNELTKRMKGQEAIIRIARKLLNRIRYVIKNNQPYEIAILK